MPWSSSPTTCAGNRVHLHPSSWTKQGTVHILIGRYILIRRFCNYSIYNKPEVCDRFRHLEMKMRLATPITWLPRCMINACISIYEPSQLEVGILILCSIDSLVLNWALEVQLHQSWVGLGTKLTNPIPQLRHVHMKGHVVPQMNKQTNK